MTACIGEAPSLVIDGKVNSQSSASSHESQYNVRTSTMMGFCLLFGYSRSKDQGSTTHAWVSWSEGLLEWQRQMAVDFLCNIVGYRGPFNNDGLSRIHSSGSCSRLGNGGTAAAAEAAPAAAALSLTNQRQHCRQPACYQPTGGSSARGAR
jgi:hypothetical protein